MKLLRTIIQFIKVDVWRISMSKLPRHQHLLIIPTRILLIAFRGFREDMVMLRASALTFYSMLSVVPVVAMGFGIAKGFGFEKMLEKQLMEKFSERQEVFEWIITFAHRFLDNTKGGVIAGIGIVILLWTVMKVFGNIESSFNAIWHVHKARVWFRKFSDYLTMMLIAPVLLILSTSANVFIATQINNITTEVELLGYLSPLIFFFVKLIPYLLFWFVLTIIYMVMPNTNVTFKSAFVAGVIAGTLFVFVQWLYIYFQLGVSKYNAIYGSFAALPLFLIWLQTSWLIVLLGAEVSFAVQNVEKYEFDPDIENISNFSRKIVTLMIMHKIIKLFEKGEPPMTAKTISQQLEIPLRLVHDVMFTLITCRLIAEVSTQQEKEKAYQPAFDIHKLSVSYILTVLDQQGSDKVLTVAAEEKNQFEAMLKSFDETLQKHNRNILLKDI